MSMRGVARLLGVLAWMPMLASAGDDPGLIDAGRRIYREGVLVSGDPLVGTGAAGVRLSGAQAACMTCHRRSGYGSSEGSVTIRSITGPALFGARTAPLAPGLERMIEGHVRHSTAPIDAAAEAAMARAQALRAARANQFSGSRQRPNYDEALLARAIRGGVDVTGIAMNPAMPRFDLGERDLHALTAYLRTLSAEISPGVTEDKVYFATVIQPGVDPAARRAMLEVLQAFIRDRNLGRRAEQRREQTGMVKNNQLYREWVLETWDLSGSAGDWPAQLEAKYRERPVFALISGMGDQSWSPIHEFCESHELPEVFPQTRLPVVSGQSVYSIYLNRGLSLEARALARFLRESGSGEEVVQVFRDRAPGRLAAAALKEALSEAAQGPVVHDLAIRDVPDRRFWLETLARHPSARMVLWLDERDLAAVPMEEGLLRPGAFYLSQGLGGDLVASQWRSKGAKARVIYPMDLPATRAPRLEVVRQWMRNNGIALTHEEIQMNAFLAATVTGMAVMHSADTYSRDYFIERVEHRLGTSVELSVYPRLSLGPGQRFASKGSYVAEFPSGRDDPPRVVSDWIVP